MADNQELLSYLLRIRSFWSNICLGDEHQLKKIDVATVKKCSGKAPGGNDKHYRLLHDLFESRRILGNFSDEQRSAIWTRLCEATEDRLVPTLECFFGNLEYLRQVTNCLRWLIHIKESSPQNGPIFLSQEILGDEIALKKFVENSGNSLRNGFAQALRQSMEDQRLLQVSEKCYKLVRNGNINQLELAYRHLLLFAFREFPAMPWQGKKKLAGAGSTTDPIVMFRFAMLAHKLGVRSEKVNDVLRQRPQALVFEPPDIGSSPVIISEPVVYGRPTPCDLVQYRGSIFLPGLHRPSTGQKLDFTYVFVQRSLYLDLMHLFPLTGIESLLDSAVSEIEYCLLDGASRSNTEVEDVREAEQTLRQSQEEAGRSKTNLQSQNAKYLDCESLMSDLHQVQGQLEVQNRELKELTQKLEDRRQGKRVMETQIESLRQQVEQEKEKLESSKREAEIELAGLAEMQKRNTQNSEQEIAILEWKKRDLKAEIEQLTQQAKELVS